MNKSKIFQFSLAGLIISQIAMSMEQIMNEFYRWIPVLTAKVHRKLDFIPTIEINQNIFMLVTLTLIVGIIVVAALIFLDLKWARTVILIVALYSILVALLPIAAGIYFRIYFPGLYSAPLLLLFSVLILLTRRSFHLPEFEE